jgi:YHS domain-containing protein
MQPNSKTRSSSTALRTGRAVLRALAVLAVVALPTLRPASGLQDKKPRDVTQFNLGKNGLALEGYDPVSYFDVGGGKPLKGDAKLETLYDGVRYRFANEADKALFVATPAKFEPTYGGWCAYAMAKKEKVEVDVTSFVVRDGRLFLFYQGIFNDTRAKWLKDPASYIKPADEKWAELIAPPKPKEG